MLKRYDAIYCPAAPNTAPLLKGSAISQSDEMIVVDNYLAFANLGGFPSITVPLGFDNGLPFGVNLTSRPFVESSLLNIASGIEKITGLKDLVAGERK